MELQAVILGAVVLLAIGPVLLRWFLRLVFHTFFECKLVYQKKFIDQMEQEHN